MDNRLKPLTLEETKLKEEMKERCLTKGQYTDEKAKDKFKMLCHLEDFEVKYYELLEEIKEYELWLGIRHSRTLIDKFDKEYDEEDKKKNPNRTYAGIIPDAEEVYKRYYDLKNKIDKAINDLEIIIDIIRKQPSGNDYWILERLEANKSILKDSEVNE